MSRASLSVASFIAASRAERLSTKPRASLRLFSCASILIAGFALSGCNAVSLGSFSPLASAADDDVTGSITPAVPVNMASVLDDADRSEANAALDQALDPQSSGTPVRWSNATTGRRGSFTAKGEAFVRNDQLCRVFSATVENGRTQSRYSGAACRIGGGEWTIGDVKFAQREA